MVAKRVYGRTPAERYEFHVDRSGGPDVCHPWKASVSRGYGQMRINGKNFSSIHRWAYKEFIDPELPDDQVVRHTCDNRRCQNPKHWLTGTQAQNLRDMVDRGRSTRKTHCKRGHDLEMHGRPRKDRPGQRECKLCDTIHSADHYRRTGGRGRYTPVAL